MPFAANAHSRPDYEYRVEQWLADLDQHGIGYGVIAAASLFDDANAYTLAALGSHRDRLRGTVIVPPQTATAELRDLAERGVVGVRLTWRRIDDLPDSGLHVELLSRSLSLPHLLPALAATGVDLVVDHFGVPSRDPAEREQGTAALLRALDTGRTWVKLSAGFRMASAIASEVTQRLLSHSGPSRLLWGSDAPFVNHERDVSFADTIAFYRNLVPDPVVREGIDRTALNLYFNREAD